MFCMTLYKKTYNHEQYLQGLELQDLLYFVAVATHKTCSITQVAEELYIKQSNLSSSIKNLEQKHKSMFSRQLSFSGCHRHCHPPFDKLCVKYR